MITKFLMNESIISSQGQTTIPDTVREHLGLKEGDKVRYFLQEGRVVMAPVRYSIRDLKGILPNPNKTVSLEEMDDAIAEAAFERTKIK